MSLFKQLVVGCCCLLTIPIQAETNDFAFKGLQLGSGINAFKKSNPEFFCSATKGGGRLLSCFSEKSTYFGKEAKVIWVMFLDGKMSTVDVDIRFAKSQMANSEILAHSTFNEIKKLMVTKYGNPNTESEISNNLYKKGVSAGWENANSHQFITAKDSALDLHTPDWESRLGHEISLTIKFGVRKFSEISNEIRRKKQAKDI